VDRPEDLRDQVRELLDWKRDVDRLHAELGIAGMSEKARRSFPGLVESWDRTQWIHARARNRERRLIAYIAAAAGAVTVLEPILSRLLESWKP
jgi:hypothetical protein